MCEKLECDMILLYDYFEDYLVKLLTERGCVPVFNSVVKFIGSFKVSSVYFLTHILRNQWLHSFEI